MYETPNGEESFEGHKIGNRSASKADPNVKKTKRWTALLWASKN